MNLNKMFVSVSQSNRAQSDAFEAVSKELVTHTLKKRICVNERREICVRKRVCVRYACCSYAATVKLTQVHLGCQARMEHNFFL